MEQLNMSLFTLINQHICSYLITFSKIYGNYIRMEKTQQPVMSINKPGFTYGLVWAVAQGSQD